MSRELTRQEKTAIRKLVTKWYANYDKDYGCLPLDCALLYAGQVLDWRLLPLFLFGGAAPRSGAGKVADRGAYHGNPALSRVRQGFPPRWAAALLLPGLCRDCPAGAEAGVYAP